MLDDGHRDEVQELAQRLGAHYLRGPREHAKAGNLNAALEQTKGDLVAIFDTDHIPTRSFLQETVPWFKDEEVGVVQTPHVFRNPDIFQRAFRLEGRIPNEADLFNRGIQPARDAWGGAFFVGSGAVFRREALEEIGGFQVLSITEDIHTCVHMHAAGWRSVFVDKALAVGLAAEDLSSYVVQRRRWMLGCLQIFFRDNPLFRGGLSLRQRLAYFGSLYHFFFPLARLVFWVTPLYYLFFHLHPIFSDDGGAHRAAPALSAGGADDQLGADAALAAPVLGAVLREHGERAARALDVRPVPAAHARLQGHAEGDRLAGAALRLAVVEVDDAVRGTHSRGTRQGRRGSSRCSASSRTPTSST